jgi:hypothetical protein
MSPAPFGPRFAQLNRKVLCLHFLAVVNQSEIVHLPKLCVKHIHVKSVREADSTERRRLNIDTS